MPLAGDPETAVFLWALKIIGTLFGIKSGILN